MICLDLLATGIFVVLTGQVSSRTNVEIAVLGFQSPPAALGSLSIQGAACEVAVEELQQEYDSFNISIAIIPMASQEVCYTGADGLLSEWYYRRRQKKTIPTVIMPGCTMQSQVMHLTWFWNMLTIFSGTASFEPAPEFASVAITTAFFPMTSVIRTLHNFVEMYSWTNLCLLLESDSAPNYPAMMRDFMSLGKEISNRRQVVMQISKQNDSADLVSVMETFRNVSRVMLYFGGGAKLRELLLTAESMSMTDGQYVYVAIEFFHIPGLYGKFSWQYYSGDDEMARRAFRSLFLVQLDGQGELNSAHSQSLWQTFQRKSLSRYKFTFPDYLKAQPSYVVFAAYGTIKWLGLILNETLSHRKTNEPVTGETLAKHFLGRDYPSDLSNIYVNREGTREINVTISQFLIDDTVTKVVLTQLTNDIHKLLLISPPEWNFSRPWPPLNEPQCGYRGEKVICRNRDNKDTTTLILIMSLSAGATVGIILILMELIRISKRFHAPPWWLLNGGSIIMTETISTPGVSVTPFSWLWTSRAPIRHVAARRRRTNV